MSSDLLYQISLTLVPHIGPVQAGILYGHFGTAKEIFNAGRSLLERIEGIGEIRANSIKGFKDFTTAEKEIRFIEKFCIQALFFRDDAYPKRLLNCYDPPTLLFYKGTAELNTPRIISIVGTRKNSTYGKNTVEKLIKDLRDYDIVVVSGLAYGIDSIAHKSALDNGLKTIGVVAHGLDTIYPAQNRALAKEMLGNGGILTEFRSSVKPDKYNFPSRNRIVAGISDATIIIESGSKGGSMITSGIASGYHRDVFAVPGRITDPKSSGCNELIRDNRAVLLTDAQQLLDAMGWSDLLPQKKRKQKELFPDFNDEELKILQILREKTVASLDELMLNAGIQVSSLAAGLLNLEMNNVIESLPGKCYRYMA